MERKEFLKQACAVGLCSCTVASIFAAATARAADQPSPESAPKPKAEDWRIGFMQQRYAKLLGALAARVEPAALDGALEDVGAYCAGTTDFVPPFAGNPEGFLAEIRKRWHANAAYDAAKGVVTLSFPTDGECPCALVRKGVTPAQVCQCSLGWQKHTFGLVFGRPVEAELKESLLRGGTKCAFEIRVGTKPA